MSWRGALAIIGLAGLVCVPAGLLAQQRDRPAVPVPAPAGTAVVAGRVTLSATSDTPVRRAVVTLIAFDGVDTYSAVADADGRFAFAGIPAGRYTLLARKSAYLPTAYGARRSGRPGTTLVISERQQLTELQLSLPKGGVITGALRLPSGESLPNTQVIAVPADEAAAGGRVTGATRFNSDDRGVYRIYGLQPGEYIVGAMASVGQGEVQQRATAGYDEAVRLLASMQSRPAGATVEATPPPAVATVGYAPTYYPGTAMAASASRVRVGAGEVRDGIDIQVEMVRMSRISGIVRGVGGQPMEAVQMSAEAVGPPLPISAALRVRTQRPDKDGKFLITNVTPGTYRITARAGGVTITPGSISIRGADQTEWAAADVLVTDSDVEGVILQLQPGLTFSGTLAAAGQSGPPATWKGARVAIQPPRAATGAVLNGQLLGGVSSRSATVNEDGTFEVAGLQPANYEVVVTLPSALSKTWAVQSILHGDGDVRDAPLTFDRGSMRDVKILMSEERTELAGTLSSASGQAATDYFIVIFPADRTLWHPHSPRVRVTRPEADGGFTARDLPAGEYRVAALTDVEDDEWRKSAFLESLYDVSIAITVTDGKTTRQDIRIR
jgi:hypothetical protein